MSDRKQFALSASRFKSAGAEHMDTEFRKLRADLERCHRLADNASDKLTRERLLQLAEELEQQLKAEHLFANPSGPNSNAHAAAV